MDLSDALQNIYGVLSSRSASVDEKITRLQRAKRKIEEEQNASAYEIRKITVPDLGAAWKGKRSHTFENAREDAFREMEKILHWDYDDCKQEIDSKINDLDKQRDFLNYVSGLAYQTGELLKQGDEVYEEAAERLNDLQRRLYS
ncbi:DUF5082 family protein [Bacillaceae bacterium Marseille-Q3522]|nr:DUF5082 family protein [Bacillaceae bacterium Marseille-Q3522]